MANTPRKIIVHHTAAVAPTPQFDDINQWHADRGFPLSSLGWHVGYHYVIEKNGKMETARREDEIGAHTVGHNDSSIGVCLVGNFDVEAPTKEQIGVLGSLLSALCRRYALDENDIYPHRAFANKSCFGSKLPANWAAFVYLEHEISRLQARLDLLK